VDDFKNLKRAALAIDLLAQIVWYLLMIEYLCQI